MSLKLYVTKKQFSQIKSTYSTEQQNEAFQLLVHLEFLIMYS